MKDYIESIVTIPAMQEDQTKRCNVISCKCLPKAMSDIIAGKIAKDTSER